MSDLEVAFDKYKKEYGHSDWTDEENAAQFNKFANTMSMTDATTAAQEGGSESSPSLQSQSLTGTMKSIEGRLSSRSTENITRSFAGLGVQTASTRTAAANDEDVDTGMTKSFLERRQEMFEKLVEKYPTKFGKLVSQKDRVDMLDAPATLTYGEIEFESFGVAFSKIKRMYGMPGIGTTPPSGIMQAPGGKFYDLGSGTGKPAIAAAYLHPFDLVAGVEILPGLHSSSLELAALFRSEGLAALAADGQPQATHIEFTLGDAFDLGVEDWSDGDVVFANSTCFSDSLMGRFASAAEHLKKGAIVITFTKRLPSPAFTVLDGKVYKMSWGGATVYIQQKLTDPPASRIP